MNLANEFKMNLDIYLKSNGDRTLSSKTSTYDMISVGAKGKGLLENGKMYFFEYYPKTEKAFDSKPVVIGLGKTYNNNQLAINLHYMPYDIRHLFLYDLLKSFKGRIVKEIDKKKYGKPALQKPIYDFTYEALEVLSKKYHIKYCIRQYNMKSMLKQYQIGYENWHIGCANDENFFKGEDINKAQYNYYKYINQ